MKLIDGKMVFDSGRAFDPTCGVVGLSVSGDDLEAFEGQDGSFIVSHTPGYQRLSPAECVELSDHMIERWTAFRALHEHELSPAAQKLTINSAHSAP